MFNFLFRRIPAAPALCCLLAATALPTLTPRAAAQTAVASVALQSHTLKQVLDGTAIRVAHYDADQKLRLTLALARPHAADEEKFLTALQTKSSPSFHKFLTADEWNARFSPSVEDEQKIVDWAESQGFTVTHRFPNRLLVDVEAPAGTIEKALGVTMNSYKVGDETDFANDRDPLIPASLSGVLADITGLNSIQRIKRSSTVGKGVKGPDYTAGPAFAAGTGAHGDGDPKKAPANRITSKVAGDLEPVASFTNGHADPANIPFSSQSYDYNALYALGHCCNPTGASNGSPAASSIALLTYGNFSDNDVQSFFHTYGFAWDYNNYYVDGNTNPVTFCGVGNSGCPGDGLDDEAPLDLEYSTATANSFGSYLDTAHVYVYEAANGYYSTYEDTFNFMLSDNTAKVVSTSYGGSEQDFENGNGTAIFTTMHGIFNSMVGQGFTLISASGDNGASYDCSNQDRVNYPGADPDWISAGGTRITFDGSGNFSSEVAWTGVTFSYTCSNNWGGGGGGTSVDFSQPSWQSSLGGTQRLMPDISMNADPYGTEQNYYYNGGLQGVGGTSIVAPELAGFFAQENAYLSYIGNICGSGSSACAPLGNPAPFVYEAGVYRNAAHYPFYDVTSGCNSSYYTTAYNIGYFCAGTGYDQATGWGSMNALQLAYALNWEVIPAYGNPYVVFSGPATSHWYNTTQTVAWTIYDYQPANSYPGTGIAGESQGWDSLPADPSSEAGPGSGNSFYDGPQFPNDNTGCLALGSSGCSYTVAQGCHYAYARGWNNQGESTANNGSYPEYYGPICYDTVAPSISLSYSAPVPPSGWYTSPVKVTITPSDPGGSGSSGIANTYFSFYGTSCIPGNPGNCTTYSVPLTFDAQGPVLLHAFTQDVAGNYSPLTAVYVYVDSIAPVTTLNLSGTLVSTTYESAVNASLTGSDASSGVAATYYTLDGGAKTKYTGALVITTVGSHTITYYSVDIAGNVEAVNTKTFTLTSPTGVTVSASSASVAFGQSITLTAKVTHTLNGTPTGTVQFYAGSTVIGTSTLNAGVATLTTTALPAGVDILSAYYSGATYFVASSSPGVNETVYQTTTTAVTTSGNPDPYGKSLVITATVKPSSSGTPTGTVQFFDGTSVIGSGTLSGGTATLTATSLTGGIHALKATYLGSSLDSGSSGTFNETISRAPAGTSLTSNGNPAKLGAALTFTATVTTAAGVPTGTVTFLNGTTVLATETMVGGAAKWTTSTLPLGTTAVVATYSGATDFTASRSNTLNQVIDAATTTALTASPSPAPSSTTSITLTATVTATSGTATGTATFLNGSTKLGTATVTNGVAKFTTKLPVGTNKLSATFAPTGNFLSSTSPVIAEVVQ